MRRRQALIARRRALMAARDSELSDFALRAENHVSQPNALPEGLYRDGAFTMSLPAGWSTDAIRNGVSTFRIAGDAGEKATLTVVTAAPTPNQLFARQQRNTLAGVSFTDLRRTVIDRMVSSGGWVVNDRQKDVAGQKVFEVIAQTPAGNGNREQVWNVYFTEVNGRIYSLTTQTAESSNARVTSDAEKFIGTFHSGEESKNK
jgi:hypothetical protein